MNLNAGAGGCAAQAPSVGKSFLSQAIAAAVTRGIGLPGEDRTEPGTVILMSAEDGVADTIKAAA
jgi:RecA-family ATPase